MLTRLHQCLLLVSFFGVFSLVGSSAVAQVVVKAVPDSTHFRVGDKLRLKVEVTAPFGTRIVTPKLPDTAAFALLSPVVVDTLNAKLAKPRADGNSRVRRLETWYVSAYTDDTLTFPALPYAYTLEDGTADTALSTPFRIAVAAVPTDTALLRPILPIIEEPLSWIDYAYYSAAFLTLLTLFYLVYLWWSHRQALAAERAVPPIAITIPPDIWALERLQRLANDPLVDTKHYYVELSDILRRYTEQQLGLQVMEMTTDELLTSTALPTAPFPPTDATNSPLDCAHLFTPLATLLRTADLVKFARAEPDSSTKTEHLQAIRLYILAYAQRDAVASDKVV